MDSRASDPQGRTIRSFWVHGEVAALAAKNGKAMGEQANIGGIASSTTDLMSRREKNQVVDQRDEIDPAKMELALVDALSTHKIARSVFHDGDILLSLLPLLAQEKSELTDRALKTAKSIAADIRYHKRAAYVEKIIFYMNNMEDQRLGNAASTMLVILSDNPWCYLVIDQPEVLEKLFQLLGDKEYAYTDRIVQALRNTPAKYWISFYMRPEDEKVEHWSYMIGTVKDYLKGTDAQVQASAALLRNLMSLGPPGGMKSQHIEDLNQLLEVLTKSLSEASDSEQATTERLSVIIRFALHEFHRESPPRLNVKKSLSPVIKKALEVVTPMAREPNKQAILAMLSLHANLDSTRLQDLVKLHSEALVSTIESNDPGMMQDSWELLDILLREGCRLEEQHAKRAASVIRQSKNGPLPPLERLKLRRGADLPLVDSLLNKLPN